jgi:3-dehydroquinate dehydratase-2
MEIWVINGPNLNLLGSREPEKYGIGTLADLESDLVSAFPQVTFRFFQSNHEGDLIDWVQKSASVSALIINPGGFAHTSVALSDALAANPTYKIEVHITHIFSREEYRRQSLTAIGVNASIAGAGTQGYHLAVRLALQTKAIWPSVNGPMSIDS